MNEEIRKKIVYAALGLAIIFGAYNFWPTDKSNKQVDQFPAITNITIKPEMVAGLQASLIDIKKLEPLPWGNDPFHSTARKKQPIIKRAMEWVLTGIIYNGESSVAIINNKAVGIGDMIENARVIMIDRKQVTIINGDKEITLTVTKS